MRAVATLAWPEESPSRETGQAANTTCQAPFLWAVGPAPALVLNALDSLNPIFLWLSGIPFYTYKAFSISIHLSADIYVVSMFGYCE